MNQSAKGITFNPYVQPLLFPNMLKSPLFLHTGSMIKCVLYVCTPIIALLSLRCCLDLDFSRGSVSLNLCVPVQEIQYTH